MGFGVRSLFCLHCCQCSSEYRFTGSTGHAVISKTTAYLVTDSRYWAQARQELDRNWHVIAAGSPDGPLDWIEWLADRAKDAKIGIDARMITHEKATQLNSKLQPKNSKLIYPPQNLVDLIWKDKPSRSREPIFVQPFQFTGMEAGAKMSALRSWISEQAPSVPSYSKAEAKPSQVQVASLVSSLPNIGMLSSC